MVTLVSRTCSETLETEHRLCKDTDLCLAEERGPKPGKQQEKAALNCSRNLPWLGDKRHSHKGTKAAGRGVISTNTPMAPGSQSCVVGHRGRGVLEWRAQGHLSPASQRGQEGPSGFLEQNAIVLIP